MQYVIFCIGVLVICFLIPYSSQAETSDIPTTTGTSTEPVTTRNESLPERERATPRALTTAAQVRLTNLAANVSNRLDAYVRRITNVTNRLDSRATKMGADGLDVSLANQKIAEARSELQKAETALATIDTAIRNFVQSENPRTYWQSVKTTYIETQNAIKAAHRATIEALLLLKTASTPSPAAATSSTNTTNTIE
jgi:hypothetical protein